MQSALDPKGKAGVHARWQGPRLGRGCRALQCPSSGTGPTEPSPGHRDLGDEGGGSLILGQHHFAHKADQKGDGGRQRNISCCLVSSQQRLLPEALCTRRPIWNSSRPPAWCVSHICPPCSLPPNACLTLFYFNNSSSIKTLFSYNSPIKIIQLNDF